MLPTETYIDEQAEAYSFSKSIEVGSLLKRIACAFHNAVDSEKAD